MRTLTVMHMWIGLMDTSRAYGARVRRATAPDAAREVALYP
jgi:hypothetical protein